MKITFSLITALVPFLYGGTENLEKKYMPRRNFSTFNQYKNRSDFSCAVLRDDLSILKEKEAQLKNRVREEGEGGSAESSLQATQRTIVEVERLIIENARNAASLLKKFKGGQTRWFLVKTQDPHNRMKYYYKRFYKLPGFNRLFDDRGRMTNSKSPGIADRDCLIAVNPSDQAKVNSAGQAYAKLMKDAYEASLKNEERQLSVCMEKLQDILDKLEELIMPEDVSKLSGYYDELTAALEWQLEAAKISLTKKKTGKN